MKATLLFANGKSKEVEITNIDEAKRIVVDFNHDLSATYLPVADRKVVFYCNDGKLAGFKENEPATEIVSFSYGLTQKETIYGDVLIFSTIGFSKILKCT